jgi:hypothetical protein
MLCNTTTFCYHSGMMQHGICSVPQYGRKGRANSNATMLNMPCPAAQQQYTADY